MSYDAHDRYAVKCPQCGDNIRKQTRNAAREFLTMHRVMHALGADRQAIAQATFAYAEARG